MLLLLLMACLPADAVSWTVSGPLGASSATVQVGDECDAEPCTVYDQGQGSNAGRLRLERRTASGYSGLTGWPLLGDWTAEQGTELDAAAEEVTCLHSVLEVDTADDCRVQWVASCEGAALSVDMRGNVQLPGACAD